MTQALFDKLVLLDCAAMQWEAVYIFKLQQAQAAHESRRAVEAQMFTLLNLSAWVKGKW